MIIFLVVFASKRVTDIGIVSSWTRMPMMAPGPYASERDVSKCQVCGAVERYDTFSPLLLVSATNLPVRHGLQKLSINLDYVRLESHLLLLISLWEDSGNAFCHCRPEVGRLEDIRPIREVNTMLERSNLSRMAPLTEAGKGTGLLLACQWYCRVLELTSSLIAS